MKYALGALLLVSVLQTVWLTQLSRRTRADSGHLWAETVAIRKLVYDADGHCQVRLGDVEFKVAHLNAVLSAALKDIEANRVRLRAIPRVWTN